MIGEHAFRIFRNIKILQQEQSARRSRSQPDPISSHSCGTVCFGFVPHGIPQPLSRLLLHFPLFYLALRSWFQMIAYRTCNPAFRYYAVEFWL